VPIFYSLTKSIISLDFNPTTNECTINQLYKKIEPDDTIRIWQIIAENNKPSHLAAEIVYTNGTSCSFGFFTDGTLTDKSLNIIKHSSDLKLLSPDILLNNAFVRQISTLDETSPKKNTKKKNTYLKMVHESIIGKDSHKRLIDFFDSLFEDKGKGINIDNTTPISKIELQLRSSKIRYFDDLYEMTNKIYEIYNGYTTAKNTTDEQKKILKEVIHTYSDSYTTSLNKVNLLFYISYGLKVDSILDSSCIYRPISGKFANTVRKIKHKISRSSKNSKFQIGINCARGLELLFDEFINCGTIARPSECKSKTKTFSKCHTQKNTYVSVV